LSLSLKSPQTPMHASPLSHPSYMPQPSHSSRCYHPHNRPHPNTQWNI
jgi:hypothetical protein